ncbi:TetR/AcrR family transcriptional regulator [Streptomyces sp. NPDC020996]|uniref:TetR/AcrR family transcriptional regulator n=1 Tax=Streptomyces sp. NPDC020996 TaxID=3154791 RepID=UPI0034084773
MPLSDHLGTVGRRAIRSQQALLSAAISLVTRGDKLTVAALAQESALTRQTIYSHYPDAAAVLLAATEDLIRREVPHDADTAWPSDKPPAVLGALTRHLWSHRQFYRQVIQSPVARQVGQTLNGYFRPGTRRRVGEEYGSQLPATVLEDMTLFILAGIGALLEDRILDPHDESPEDAAMRCWRAAHAPSARPAT